MIDLNDLLPWLPSGVSVLSGFGGVWLGIWSADRREIVKRRHDFLLRQLVEFYAPMLGIRREIRALSELRHTMEEKLHEAWAEKVAKAEKGMGVSRRAAEGFAEYKAAIQYDNEVFESKIMDGYRAMLKFFREKLAICSADTQAYYPELVLFVDVWERHLQKTIPIEVVKKLGHSEEKLKPFYSHIEARFSELQTKIAKGAG